MQGNIQQDSRYNNYVTGIQITPYSMSYAEEFEADRPFMYNIIKTSSNQGASVSEAIPIFIGQIIDPKY